MHNNYSNYNINKSFQPTTPLIGHIDYSNKNNLLHNNVHDKVLDENIIEYKIDIDSIDRDITVYPDPFSFVVNFAPIPSSCSYGQRMGGTPTPHILIDFRNVKYIKLQNIILPIHNRVIKNPKYNHNNNNNNNCSNNCSDIDSDSDTKSCSTFNSANKQNKQNKQNNIIDDLAKCHPEQKYIFDPCSNLLEDRFVELIVKELTDNRIYTTGDDNNRIGKFCDCYIPAKPFGLILPDRILNKNFYSGSSYTTLRIYESSCLGNITQLSISFCDSYGEPLKFHGLLTCQELIEMKKKGHPVCQDDLRHPLNRKVQVHLSFIIGVSVANINNMVQYAK